MEEILSFFTNKYLGIPLWIYFASLGAILTGFIAKMIAAAFFQRLIKLTEKTKLEFDDILLKALSKPVEWAAVLAGVYLAIDILPLPSKPVDFPRFVGAFALAVGTTLIIWFSVRLVNEMSDWAGKKAALTESKLDDQLVPIIRRSLKVFLYVIGVTLVLQNLGYSITSLVAGLGIGGLAFALAAKDGLANLFGSIVVFMDKPFQVGDWIEMGNIQGTVEEVGLRTTRIRTFANSLITLPNSMFTTQAVNNWTRMKKRRIKMSIGVTYSTTPSQLDELVKRIKQIIEEDKNIRNDFYIVNFDNFGPSSLDIFIYCFTETTVWAEFLQAKQELMLKIMNCICEMGLSFAFPTQSIHVESMPNEPKALSGQRPN